MPNSFLYELDFHRITSVTIGPIRKHGGSSTLVAFNVRDITFKNSDNEVFVITLYAHDSDHIDLHLADKSTHAI